MAARNILPANGNGKTTFIYGLIDPRTQELRYVGKTVFSLKKRLRAHRWKAANSLSNSHCMNWMKGLMAAGLDAEIAIIEVVPPHGDWVDRERHWIAYFRSIGARLCNHTDGGEGTLGIKQSPELVAKRNNRSRSARLRLAEQSRDRWISMRGEIIAAQNEGKGVEWRRKQSDRGKLRAKCPASDPFLSASRKLWKLKDGDVSSINQMLAVGVSQISIARTFHVDPSLISHIKHGRRRP